MKRTCNKCLLLDQCEIGGRNKPACGDYISDPWRLEKREARWTFKEAGKRSAKTTDTERKAVT